jgi:type II secretory pathway pseudopilin PulG
MVFKYISNLKFINSQRGITIIEIAVVITIVVLFSSILIADFPRLQRQFALSRVSYKLTQDFRKTQDLGLSGIETLDSAGGNIIVKGYGIYVNLNDSEIQYYVYADVPTAGQTEYPNGNNKYDIYSPVVYCNAQSPIIKDCIVDAIDISKENKNLYIKKIVNSADDEIGTSAGINFNPPNPTVTITLNGSATTEKEIGIVIGLTNDSSAERTVWVNVSGRIRIQ